MTEALPTFPSDFTRNLRTTLPVMPMRRAASGNSGSTLFSGVGGESTCFASYSPERAFRPPCAPEDVPRPLSARAAPAIPSLFWPFMYPLPGEGPLPSECNDVSVSCGGGGVVDSGSSGDVLPVGLGVGVDARTGFVLLFGTMALCEAVVCCSGSTGCAGLLLVLTSSLFSTAFCSDPAFQEGYSTAPSETGELSD